MLRINLPPNTRLTLITLHQNYIHHIIRQRAHVLLLRAEGISNTQILSLTGLSEPTIIDYVHQYLGKGKSWITVLNVRKPQANYKFLMNQSKLILTKILFQPSHRLARKFWILRGSL